MSARKVGIGFIILGTLGIVFSLLSDFLFGGKPGIQSAQILVIEFSIAILLIGVGALTQEKLELASIGRHSRELIDQMLNLPVWAWVLIAFVIAFTIFYISPVFLNAGLRMNYFNKFMPDRAPIGNDLIAMTDLIRGWLLNRQSPYPTQFYPPFTYVLFSPLLLIHNYATLYAAFSLLSLTAYIFLTLVFPLKLAGARNIPLILLLFIPGLFAYGLQFELERGQYNILAFLLSILSLYIFHFHKRQRIFAYLLISVAIQMKLYPAIFILMLVDSWEDWKNNLLRFAALGIFNFLLLFAMGPQIFGDFIRSVYGQIVTPSWNSPLNHSIQSFTDTLTTNVLGPLPAPGLAFLQQNIAVLRITLLVMYIILLAFSIWVNSRRGATGIDPNLLLVCTLGALIIPVSYDYTLSLLTMPMILYLCGIQESWHGSHRGISIILLLGIAFTYWSLLVPPLYKPVFLQNAFPALFLILILSSALTFIQFRDSKIPSLALNKQPAV
jgi:hypothetical protein